MIRFKIILPVQNIATQILLNFSSRFLSSPEICILACSCLRAPKSKNGPSKTRAKKLKTLLQFKNIFQILLLFLSPLSSYCQEIKDTTVKKNKFNVGIFISGDISTTQYYSDAFFNYLFIKTGLNKPYEYSNYSSPVISGTTVPNKFNYNKSAEYPAFSIGLELSSRKEKKIKLNHMIVASYKKFSGQYSGSDSYSESGLFGPQGTYLVNVMDTVLSKYNHTVISLGYKFQPTYKFIFLSIGANIAINNLKINSEKREYINGSWSVDFQPPNPFSSNSTTDTTYRINFINFPLQLGAGVFINIKSIILKPAFSFSPCFVKGYNYYSISLDILYQFQRK